MKGMGLVATGLLCWIAGKTSPPASAQQAGKTFLCTNREHFEGSLTLEMKDDLQSAELRRGESVCAMDRVEYHPISERYQGWIRFGAPDGDAACAAIGTELFGADRESVGTDGVDIHWLSVGREMQAGNDGFSQLGYQNIWDPGAGGTAKAFLRCRPRPASRQSDD